MYIVRAEIDTREGNYERMTYEEEHQLELQFLEFERIGHVESAPYYKRSSIDFTITKFALAGEVQLTCL